MSKIVNFIKGIFVGIALVIPGLSGSIFAVVVGLYEKIINAISTLKKNLKKNILFLLPIVLGAVVGVLLSAKLIIDLCEKYPQQAYFFFIGLVLGSVPLVVRKMNKIKFKPLYLLITFFALGFILLMGILSGNEAETTTEVAYHLTDLYDVLAVFVSGFLSCALMSIPGVSGSVTLMVLGQYNKVYGAVGECTVMIKHILKGDFDAALNSSRAIWTALVFAVGGILGFLIIAKLISRLLAKFEAQVYYGVAGMILGAVIILFKNGVMLDDKFTSIFKKGISSGIISMLLIDILLVIIGVICTLFLDDDSAMAQKMKKKNKSGGAIENAEK